MRVTVQLIHGPTDKHVWAESYNRELQGILALQSDVARAIAQEIRVKLTPEERARLVSVRPVNPAHEAYLQGRYHWNKWTPAGLKRSLEYFQQAVEIDPTYALGYAGLADAYNSSAALDLLQPKEAYPKAKAAALKALELDPTLAEAYTPLGMSSLLDDWDWLAAESNLKRAIELKPGYANGHHAYAAFLGSMGRHEEALAEINRAQELDPLSLPISMGKGSHLFLARRYDQAIEQARRVLELDRNFPAVHALIGRCYEQKGCWSRRLRK